MAKTGRGGRRNHKLNRPTSASSSTPPAGPTNVKLTGKTLPEELINKILIRVPVKSLVRFRCVSKSWLLRTLHPKFISMHLNHNILYNKQLICNTYANDVVNNKRVYNGKKVVAFLSPHDPTVIPVLSIDMMSAVKSDYPLRINFNDFCKDMVFAGSVNGIVLLSHRKEMKGRFVVLWNPAINMWKRIRVPERKFESDCSDSFATETAIGLGFDVVSDDFMIVRIVPVYHSLSRECCRSRVEIYSASHDSWTDICKDDCIPFWPIKAVCDFIIKGVLYFVGLDWLPEDLEGSIPHHHVILGAFDPCTSSYKKFFFPKHERNESSRVRPLNWKDSVAALVQSPGKYPNPVVDMYLLDEINGNWTKVYTIGPHSFEELRIPQCFITGELVLDTWAGDSERVPYFCNPEIRDPVFFNKEFGTLDPNWYDSYTHVESLVCVMGMELIGKENKNKTLPEDMINEILIRTPVKSLVRFRCVSKSWLLRTLHPKFISMHLTHNTLRKPKQLICNIHDYMTNTKLVAFLHLRAPIIPVRRSIDVNSADKPEYPREINFDDFFKDMILAGSINGIMCLTINTVICFSKYKEMKGRSVALWNPAINMWKPIRLPERKSGFDRLDVMSVGLGFDKATDDYKIVRIVPVVLPPDLQECCWSRVEIYSAKCDSWMDLEKEGLAPFWPKLPNCNFIINDCPYWVGADRLPGDFTPFNPFQNEMLASLDPCTGMYKKVWYPKYVKNISTVVNPLKWKDSLALLIQSPGESPNSTVDMYKLDENTESWTKIYTIGEHQFEGLRIPQCLATGEIVLMTWKGDFVHAKLNPYFWNPETTDSFIKKREFANINLLWYESYSHTESLVCFKGMEIIGEDKNNGKEDGNKKKSKPPKKNWAELLSKDFETLLNLN